MRIKWIGTPDRSTLIGTFAISRFDWTEETIDTETEQILRKSEFAFDNCRNFISVLIAASTVAPFCVAFCKHRFHWKHKNSSTSNRMVLGLAVKYIRAESEVVSANSATDWESYAKMHLIGACYNANCVARSTYVVAAKWDCENIERERMCLCVCVCVRMRIWVYDDELFVFNMFCVGD